MPVSWFFFLPCFCLCYSWSQIWVTLLSLGKMWMELCGHCTSTLVALQRLSHFFWILEQVRSALNMSSNIHCRHSFPLVTVSWTELDLLKKGPKDSVLYSPNSMIKMLFAQCRGLCWDRQCNHTIGHLSHPFVLEPEQNMRQCIII